MSTLCKTLFVDLHIIWTYFIFYVSGEWKDLEFKEYNYTAKGQPLEGGNLHPLLKARRHSLVSYFFPTLFDI